MVRRKRTRHLVGFLAATGYRPKSSFQREVPLGIFTASIPSWARTPEKRWTAEASEASGETATRLPGPAFAAGD